MYLSNTKREVSLIPRPCGLGMGLAEEADWRMKTYVPPVHDGTVVQGQSPLLASGSTLFGAFCGCVPCGQSLLLPW